MPIKCCKDCIPPKRYPGCHDHCPEYIEERAEYDKLKAANFKKTETDYSIKAQKYDGVRRALKRRGASGNK